jgi:proteasome lid subunit RPN8/RPN11
MKIIKTKEIVPSDISQLGSDLKEIFKDRTKLHNETIPPFFAYIQDYAWEAFLSHGNNVYKTIKHEAQGILLGKYCKDEYGEFIVATKYAEGDGNSTQSYVEMTEERLAEISVQCQNEDLLMLIWLHTHPGFGVFYSGTDIGCLKTNFYKKYQAGIVVDILKKHDKGYKTENSNVNEFQDYLIINSNDSVLEKPFSSQVFPPKKKIVALSKTRSVEKGLIDIENKLKGIEEIQQKTINTINFTNTNIKDIEKLFLDIKFSNNDNDAFASISEKFTEIAEISKGLNEDTNSKLTLSLKEINIAFDEFKSNINQISIDRKDEKDNINSIIKKFEKLNETTVAFFEIQLNDSKTTLDKLVSISKKTNINRTLLFLISVLVSILILLNGYYFFKQ